MKSLEFGLPATIGFRFIGLSNDATASGWKHFM
jgi:hypothetical protein